MAKISQDLTIKKSEYNRKHYLKFRESYKAAAKKYYDNNKAAIQARRKPYRDAQRCKAIEHLGGKCLGCGFDDFRALQIDHINGGGNQERKQLSCGPTGYYKLVIEDTTGKYQLLCANCNMIKRIENGEHKS